MDRKILSRIAALLMASMMVLCSCAAVFAETEALDQSAMQAEQEELSTEDAYAEEGVYEEDPELTEDSVDPAMEDTEYPANGDEPSVCTHEWSEWTTTKAATYFAAGTRQRECAVCGETETATIAKKIAKNRWVKNGNKKYYFNGKGKVLKGWNKVKASNKKNAPKVWCFFGSKGALKKKVGKNAADKWVRIGKKRYYITEKGKMVPKGFRIIKGKLYYFDKNHAVKTRKFKSGGVKYKPNKKSGAITGDQFYIYKYRTFVIVDISSQRLRFYKNGKLRLKADVITGRKGVHDTPRGIFSIRYRKRNIRLSGGAYVHYWMAFIGTSYGLHDAVTWRSSSEFSNHNTYKYNGSHGCINMRYGDAAKLYKKAPDGTKVIVQS